MASKLREVLARIADELEDEEVREEFADLKEKAGKELTIADVLKVVRDAPPEERAQLRQILAEEGVPTNGEPPGKPKPKDKPPSPPPNDEPPPPANRRTRPGRRAGGAYDWYVDEETGEVVRSPVAIVYSGEDEPDEVEMLPKADDEPPPPPPGEEE